MIVVVLIFCILAILLLLIFTASLKARFVFDTEESNMNLTLFWLPPLFKAVIEMVRANPVLTVIILHKRVYSKVLKSRRQKISRQQLFTKINPQELVVNAHYGFLDPFATGIVTGVINIISSLVNIASVRHYPDFTASRDYIYVDATARINIGTALLNLLRS